MNFCRHCGREITEQWRDYHEAHCPDSPAISEQLSTILADPDNPGYAIGKRRYNAIDNKPLDSNTLIRHYNGWCNAVVRFGLKPSTEKPQAPRRRRTRDGLGQGKRTVSRDWGMEPLTDAERHACSRRGVAEFDGTQGVHSHWHAVDVW
jgi:hypothetical protein